MTALNQDLRILLVDDNTIVRDMLVDLVQSLGYRADAAASGAEAIALFESHRYGVVLTDLVIHGMSGWTLLAAFGQRDAHPTVIIARGSPPIRGPGAARAD